MKVRTPRPYLTLFVGLVLFAVTGSFSHASAQFASAIEGVVTDSTGAVVPGATTVAIHEATGVRHERITNEAGAFRISFLPPGVYRVEVLLEGFRTWVRTDVTLEANQVRTISPMLEAGDLETMVEVSAAGAVVETARVQTAREVEQRTIEQAPMSARNIYAGVAWLAPGVTGTGRHGGGTPTLGTDNYGTELQFEVYAAGQRLEANDYQLDGSSIVVQSRGGAVYISPSPDMVDVVKVSASDFSADRGRTSGAQIQVFTKAGTNTFRGTLSQFYTSNALTARTVFQTQPLPDFRRNEFGGTLGGPLVRNRTFFFGSFHMLRASRAETVVGTVETPEFARYVTTNFPNSVAAAFFRESPPGAVPSANILTVGQLRALDPGFSDSSAIPNDLPAIGTAILTRSLPRPGHQWSTRVDHHFQGGDRLFVNIIGLQGDQTSADIRPTQAFSNMETGLYTKINWTRAIRPTLLNEASFTYVRNTGDWRLQQPHLPSVSVTRVSGFGAWGPGLWAHNDFNWQNVVSWMRGHHHLRFGTSIMRQAPWVDFTEAYQRPSFSFPSLLDFAQDFPSSQSGPLMDTRTGEAAVSYARERELHLSGFVQDDWRLTSRVTLNLGLRYEDFRHLESITLNRDPVHVFALGPGGTLAEQVANGFMELRGNGVRTSELVNGFAPRIGFGWDLFGDGTTGLRGGYGIYYTRLGGLAVREYHNPPTYVTPSVSIFDQQPFTYGVGPGFSPPPDFTVRINERGGIEGLRVSAMGLEHDLSPPTTHSWMLNVQRSLGRNLLVQAYYNGTHNRNLYIRTDVNRFAGDLIVNEGRRLRLNPFFGPISFGQSNGISDTHFGSIAAGKRYSDGWSVQGIFTFGRGTDFNSSSGTGPGGAANILDPMNVAAQRGLSDFNVSRRFSLDSVVDIPVPWRTGLAARVLGGWQLATMVLLQGGQPFSVFTSASWPVGDYNADGFNYDFPNTPAFGTSISANRDDFLRGVFRAQDFPRPAPGQQGDLRRNAFIGPGYANVDMMFGKATPIPWFNGQGMLQIRAEVFNVFNRVNLARPAGNMASGLFGRSTSQSPARSMQFGVRIGY